MTVRLPRRQCLRAALGLGAAGLLPSARACEFFAPTLRIFHPWTRATAEGADEAVVSMKFDGVQRADRLVGVQTPVALHADIAGALARPVVDFAIPAGRDSELAEGGTWLRLSGLQMPLHVGRAYPLTLQFEHGGEVPAQLSIDFPSFRFR
ncbi:copper chaperone PCu(A)C [Ideonella sp. DXS22W]|uniref:Copper chaperone PCu(A)C n=1 Tax=Pseudaquabacterium inlustre TaxID=2984192 RepID=A0ABU9CDQ7_9BURK